MNFFNDECFEEASEYWYRSDVNSILQVDF
jgi:hypothetical protein